LDMHPFFTALSTNNTNMFLTICDLMEKKYLYAHYYVIFFIDLYSGIQKSGCCSELLRC
jgi:hypothetical protein